MSLCGATVSYFRSSVYVYLYKTSSGVGHRPKSKIHTASLHILFVPLSLENPQIYVETLICVAAIILCDCDKM